MQAGRVSAQLCKVEYLRTQRRQAHGKGEEGPLAEEVKARIKQLVQQPLQKALEAELEDYLGYAKNGKAPSENTRNGYSEKTVRTDTGDLDLKVPRDRKSDFEPQLIRKRQTVPDDREDKIVARYAKGMTRISRTSWATCMEQP